MKKIFKALFILLLVSGCAKQVNDNNPPKDVFEGYNVLVPTGAPALAVVSDMANSELNTYTLTSGADMLTTELAKSDSEFDVIIAPINAGSKLISMGKSEYILASVLTWGNLYLVGTKDSNENDSISAFGEAAVPGVVFKHIMSEAKMDNEVTFYPAVSEAQGALLAGKTKLALLAEPAVTATIAKGKQLNMNLIVKDDLQKKWESIYGTYGYPQAAIFVKNDLIENNKDSVQNYLDTIKSYLDNKDMDVFSKAVETYIEEIGVPSSQIAVNSYDRQNIKYVFAIDAKSQIEDFLSIFKIELSDDSYMN